MNLRRYLEVLIFGKRALETKKLLEEKHNKMENLISRIEDERILLQAGNFSEAKSEGKKLKAESDRISAVKF